MTYYVKWKHKGLVEWVEDKTAFLSVVFTWRLQDAYQRAVWLRASGYRVQVGGPALFTAKLRSLFENIATVSDHYPDAISHHHPQATIASRGCPVGCWFCIVPKMEGREFTLLPDFPVRPILCDNNLSALPVEYQDHIITRYQREKVPLLDANSGFEPATFSEEVYRRWHVINRGPWRFAYDEQGERDAVWRVLRMLKDEPPTRKQVYVLIGNEPFASCLDRLKEVIAWGGEPYAQAYIKLNATERKPHVRFDWSAQLLTDMQRWINRRYWKYVDFAGYRRTTAPPALSCHNPQERIGLWEDNPKRIDHKL